MPEPGAHAIPEPTPRKAPLAESEDLADLLDDDGNIKVPA